MSKIYQNVLELIGNTPLLEPRRYNAQAQVQAKVLVKLEYLNPAGSAKDRIAKAMIEDAERKGILKQGSVIIEPTSGNTGIGLAAVAAAKGYRAIFTMPETMRMMRYFGWNGTTSLSNRSAVVALVSPLKPRLMLGKFK